MIPSDNTGNRMSRADGSAHSRQPARDFHSSSINRAAASQIPSPRVMNVTEHPLSGPSWRTPQHPHIVSRGNDESMLEQPLAGSGSQVQVQVVSPRSNITVTTNNPNNNQNNSRSQQQQQHNLDEEIDRVINEVFNTIKNDMTMDELELQLELHECRLMRGGITQLMLGKSEKIDMEFERRDIALSSRKAAFLDDIRSLVRKIREDRDMMERDLILTLRTMIRQQPAQLNRAEDDNFQLFAPVAASTPARPR